MDGITEKFTIFDYFNSVIGGIVFLIGIGCFTYPNSVDMLTKIATVIGESTFLLIMAIILFIAVASVVGSAINAIGTYVFKKWVKWESRFVRACLTDEKVVGNFIKFDNYQKKAEKYFESTNYKVENKDNLLSFSEKQCSCFYAHCVYYNQIRNQSSKTERLRDVQGLSCILSTAFAILAIIGICPTIHAGSCQLTLIRLLMILCCIFFLVIFTLKYRYDVECRVRMVLAVYDVTVEKELAEHDHTGAI